MPRPKKKVTEEDDEKPARRGTTGMRPDIQALVDSINKDFGEGRILIQSGAEISYLQASRWTSGSLGLDVALNGGIPKGMIVQFMGEESSGKTTQALKVAAALQRALGEQCAIAWIAVEGFDKKWANQCGCSIEFSRDELKLMSREEQNRWDMAETIGTFLVAQAVTGEDALELALRFIRSAKFNLVVVDSIAALIPMSEEEKEMAEKTMGKLPSMVTQFLRKAGSAFAARTDDDGPNETSLILINQVRDVIGSYGHPAPQPPGGRGLRHFSVANVRFVKGEILKDADDEEKLPYGKRTKIKVEKCKIGPPYREAEFEQYFREHGEFQPGDINLAQEVRIWGTRAGVIQQTNNKTWEIDGKKIIGKDAVDTWLREHPQQCEALRKATLAVLTST